MAAMLTTMACLTACSGKNESDKNVKNDNTKESIELSDGVTESIEVKNADVTDELKVVNTELVYGDDEILVFKDYYGLFVYSVKENKVVNSLDVKYINCDMNQGDNACSFRTYNNGQIIELYTPEESYSFYWKENKLLKDYNTSSEKEDSNENISYAGLKLDDGTYDCVTIGDNKLCVKNIDNQYAVKNLYCVTVNKDGEIVSQNKIFESKDTDDNKETFSFYADVTNDGVEDEIKVNAYVAKDINSANEYWDTDTVEIFSGKTKEKIGGKKVSPVHMEQDGLYVYNDGENDYIVEMCLYMNQGNAVYKYSVWNLTEDGKTEEKDNGEVSFSVNDSDKKSEDADNIRKFEQNVNKYLEKAYVLVDNNYDEVNYSTSDNKKVLTYDSSEIINELSKRD